MQDAFGRELKAGDLVLYATRSGSSQHLNVAVVDEIVKKPQKYSNEKTEIVRATCVACNDSDFTHGKMKWDATTRTYDYHRLLSRKVVLKVSGNMMIVNGIDLDALTQKVQQTQSRNIEETLRRQRGD